MEKTFRIRDIAGNTGIFVDAFRL
jgi:hypothetical protein